MKAATIEPLRHGLMADFSDLPFPSAIYGVRGGGHAITFSAEGTAYGYIDRGNVMLIADGRGFFLDGGSFFSIPARRRMKILGENGKVDTLGFVCFRIGYVGLCLIGTGLERRGRLKYIDGCSDTLLLAPPLKGDPCLNLLHFPPGIVQTRHTHPTVRAGLIHRGRGACWTADGMEALNTGSVFILAPDAEHAFETDRDEMQLTVFHPDSDFGPTHEEHPMLNRTIVGGRSAKEIDAIRTKEIV